MQGRWKIAPLLVLLVAFGTLGLSANFSATPAQAQDAAENLHLGDLMNESMQVHHSKLWLAGHANNWPLAAYEVRKIKETIEELKELIVEIQKGSSKWQKVPVGEMLRAVDSHLNDLDAAVKAKDPAKFEAAYRELTAACNACHVRAGESQIRIMQPTGANNFIDQDFTAGGKAQ